MFAGRAVASAQTVIDSLPVTISAGGQYVLGVDFQNTSSSTPAITINAPNVILDLGGHVVSGSGNTAATNSVVRIGNYANVTVRNGLIANEEYGILVTGGSNARNYVFENLAISRCYFTAIIVFADAPGTLIRNNIVSNIGGASGGGSAIGIFSGVGARFENNTVTNSSTSLGGSSSVGIETDTGSFLIGNTITNFTTGISGGKYLNNLTSGCNTPFTGGVNATGNN